MRENYTSVVAFRPKTMKMKMFLVCIARYVVYLKIKTKYENRTKELWIAVMYIFSNTLVKLRPLGTILIDKKDDNIISLKNTLKCLRSSEVLGCRRVALGKLSNFFGNSNPCLGTTPFLSCNPRLVAVLSGTLDSLVTLPRG